MAENPKNANNDILLTIHEARQIQQFLFRMGDTLNNITMSKSCHYLGYALIFNPIALDSWYAEVYQKLWRKELSLGANLMILWGGDSLELGFERLKEFLVLTKVGLDNATLESIYKEAILWQNITH